MCEFSTSEKCLVAKVIFLRSRGSEGKKGIIFHVQTMENLQGRRQISFHGHQRFHLFTKEKANECQMQRWIL